jgi:hypothetical protein
LDELGVALANFEGMTFGPRLPMAAKVYFWLAMIISNLSK